MCHSWFTSSFFKQCLMGIWTIASWSLRTQDCQFHTQSRQAGYSTQLSVLYAMSGTVVYIGRTEQHDFLTMSLLELQCGTTLKSQVYRRAVQTFKTAFNLRANALIIDDRERRLASSLSPVIHQLPQSSSQCLLWRFWCSISVSCPQILTEASWSRKASGPLQTQCIQRSR
jgi:hypothetical protein